MDLTRRLSVFFTPAIIALFFFACGSESNKQQAIEKGYNPRAKDLYFIHCSACHGISGSDGPLASKLRVKPQKFLVGEFLYGSQLDDVVKVITKGVEKNQMPSWQKILKKKDIRLLAEFTLFLANRPEDLQINKPQDHRENRKKNRKKKR